MPYKKLLFDVRTSHEHTYASTVLDGSCVQDGGVVRVDVVFDDVLAQLLQSLLAVRVGQVQQACNSCALSSTTLSATDYNKLTIQRTLLQQNYNCTWRSYNSR